MEIGVEGERKIMGEQNILCKHKNLRSFMDFMLKLKVQITQLQIQSMCRVISCRCFMDSTTF